MTADGLELIADGFNFPTSLAFDDAGKPIVAESGLPFAGAPPGGKVWRLEANGQRSLLAVGLTAPVNGLRLHRGHLLISEGGHPARLISVDSDGEIQVLVEGFAGPGNYHLNMAVVGPDEKLYFSQGAMTNLGIVGLDALEIGWLKQLPHGHDVPGLPITLAGVNITTPDPTADSEGAIATTGAFAPFGTRTARGHAVAAGLPATASIMRCNLDGTELELVAWGLRNAFGLGFLPDGRLLAIDQGADDRGSRPIGNAPDALFEIRQGAWYGWPDFVAGIPVTDERFAPTRGNHPSFVLEHHDLLPSPERALLEFPPHVAAVKFDNGPAGSPFEGSLLVALFGDEAPMTAPKRAANEKVGRGVGIVDTNTWQLSSLISGHPLSRPIDVRVHDDAIWILDFGVFEMTDRGMDAQAGTGRLWRLPLANLSKSATKREEN